jgi:LysM repeat protein
VIIAGVIASVHGYRPFVKNREQASAASSATNMDELIRPPVLVPPEHTPQWTPSLLEHASKANPEVDELTAEAMRLIGTKPSGVIQASDKLNEALSLPMNRQQQAVVKKQLSKLADKWLFNRTVFEGDKLCGSYKVKPGDQLRAIGRRFKVPHEILMRINNIGRPEVLRAGEMIKVINGPFHTKIYRSTFTMDLYLQDSYVRSFPVVLGQAGMETPTGCWVVKPAGKLISPTWTDPTTGRRYEADDPDYPLGSRWIGLEGIVGAAKGRTGFAIHGTKNQKELGTARSRGCIRLYDEDVKLVYDLLTPGLSQVVIVE